MIALHDLEKGEEKKLAENRQEKQIHRAPNNEDIRCSFEANYAK
jgi:hypothetical protein